MKTLDKDRRTALGHVASIHKAKLVGLDRSIALNAGKISVGHKLPPTDSSIPPTARAHGARIWTRDAAMKTFKDVKYIPKKQESSQGEIINA